MTARAPPALLALHVVSGLAAAALVALVAVRSGTFEGIRLAAIAASALVAASSAFVTPRTDRVLPLVVGTGALVAAVLLPSRVPEGAADLVLLLLVALAVVSYLETGHLLQRMRRLSAGSTGGAATASLPAGYGAAAARALLLATALAAVAVAAVRLALGAAGGWGRSVELLGVYGLVAGGLLVLLPLFAYAVLSRRAMEARA
ncbi:MAG: hypothetical protein ACT4PT_01815 [Methanobacteriota archaeon]